MMSRIPFPVVATHDICKGLAPLIKSGTPGEITGISGATPSHYTVSFWPFGPEGVAVTLSYLTRNDLREA
jgi:hypothetical protein